MQSYTLADLQNQRRQTSQRYLEFLRVPSISMGLYELAIGEIDTQQPHTEDEVYYITGGQGILRVGEEDHLVSAGSIVYVAANVPHRFHSIIENLSILVFFAPAEYTAAKA